MDVYVLRWIAMNNQYTPHLTYPHLYHIDISVSPSELWLIGKQEKPEVVK